MGKDWDMQDELIPIHPDTTGPIPIRHSQGTEMQKRDCTYHPTDRPNRNRGGMILNSNLPSSLDCKQAQEQTAQEGMFLASRRKRCREGEKSVHFDSSRMATCVGGQNQKTR